MTEPPSRLSISHLNSTQACDINVFAPILTVANIKERTFMHMVANPELVLRCVLSTIIL